MNIERTLQKYGSENDILFTIIYKTHSHLTKRDFTNLRNNTIDNNRLNI